MALVALPAAVHAQINSPGFQVDEVMIGTGGDPEICSDGYCALQSAGGTGGSASSNNYGLQAGFGSPDEPTLVVVVTNNVIDLGVLNSSSTAAASANFSVSTYLSAGYVVRIHGNSPRNVSGSANHTLDAMDGAGGSIPGIEQFGINLRANTVPGIGVDPIQFPDDSFAYGSPTTAYNQPDIYKYEDGDTIAESNAESGQTDYTISIIANVATITPGGRYQTTLVIQAIATF